MDSGGGTGVRGSELPFQMKFSMSHCRNYCDMSCQTPINLQSVLYTDYYITDYLGLVAGNRFGRELNLCGFQDGVLLQDVLLGLVMAKWLKNKNKSNLHGYAIL